MSHPSIFLFLRGEERRGADLFGAEVVAGKFHAGGGRRAALLLRHLTCFQRALLLFWNENKTSTAFRREKERSDTSASKVVPPAERLRTNNKVDSKLVTGLKMITRSPCWTTHKKWSRQRGQSA